VQELTPEHLVIPEGFHRALGVPASSRSSANGEVGR
jgi:hypothetical protein